MTNLSFLATQTSKWSLCALIAVLGTGPLQAQLQPLEEDQGIGGYGLSLRKLGRTGSLLYITAHPDDENNAVLVKTSRGQGMRTGLLTLTRGDGGQNEIGPELFQALGVLRSEELLALHRFDGAEQYFSLAYEFGYSFSVEETFEKWGKEATLGDIVRVIRTFRPQIVVTLNPGGPGGGQHHQASARLAAEAFRAAADPNRFPEQISREGLHPWQARRLYQSARFRRDREQEDDGDTYSIAVGEFDPLLGETYLSFGLRARSNHRCQGMNTLPEPSERNSFYSLADSPDDPPPAGDDLFQGLETGLEQVRAYEPRLSEQVSSLQAAIDEANLAYQRSDYRSSAAQVMKGLALVRRAAAAAQHPEVRRLLELEELDFIDAAAKGHFLHLDAFVQDTRDGIFIPGEKFKVQVRVFDWSGATSEHRIVLGAPIDWTVKGVFAEGRVWEYEVQVAENPHFDQPYWYLPDPKVDRYATRDGSPGTRPFSPPQLTVRLEYQAEGIPAWLEIPVQYRWYDPAAAKERRMAVKAAPEISLLATPEVAVVSTLRPRPIELKVLVHNNRPRASEATVRLQAPPGWHSEPASKTVAFRFENEETTLKFRLHPPESPSAGEQIVQAVAESEGKVFTEGYQTISYHHIQTRHLYRPAQIRLRTFEFDLPEALTVGYVEGVGDEVGLFTELLGATVVYLGEDDLATSDLSRFDAIVLGVRAYLREDLAANNRRLLDYVEQGGLLAVQWNKYEFMREQYAPYPVKINRSADRISVEEALVKVLSPDHAVFNFPNRIGDDDWRGWVQERATYMLGEWDERFQPLLEMEDPVPYNAGPKQGGLLYARYGQGIYLHVGLAFFRQLPAGVPGAYRLWANILSLGRR